MAKTKAKKCPLCDQEGVCHVLCPQRHIESDEKRLLALDMGVPVATSDWVDVLLAQIGIEAPTETQRTIATELLSMHHRFIERTLIEAFMRGAVAEEARAAIVDETEQRIRKELQDK